MKKMLAILLTAALLLCAAPLAGFTAIEWPEINFGGLFQSAKAAEIVDSGNCGAEGDGSNLTWTLDSDGLLTIRGEGGMNRFLSKNPSSPWYNNTSIKKVVIEEGVTNTGRYAFYKCSGLISVTLPQSLTLIRDGSFFDCGNLAELTVNENNPVYGSSGNCIFQKESKTLIVGCKTTVIPSDGSVTVIGSESFTGCTGLTSITIPDCVTSIEGKAFNECTNLTEVIIGSGVERFGSRIFSGCVSLEKLSVSEDNPIYHSEGNCIIATESKSLIIGCKSSVIPTDGSVTSIGDDAFAGCIALTSITIPDSITSIGNSAFFDCSGLTEISIPNGVTSIGDDAFRNCAGLKSVTIPGSAANIGDGAFLECTGMTALIISDGVTSIGNSAFNGCTGLKQVTIPASVTSIGGGIFSACKGLISVTISDGIKSIGDGMFSGCTGLKSLNIPASIERIGATAFMGCTGLVNVTIPVNVTSIGDFAFYGCTGLTSVILPDGIKTIGFSAFCNCSSLKSITIPKNTTEIGTDSIPKNTIIIGYADSYAQQWAENNGNTFQLICNGNHQWNAGEVTTPPSCTTDGSRIFTCTVCNITRTEAIAAPGHQLTKTEEKEANCTEEGNIAYYTCSVCGKTFRDAEGTEEVTNVTIPADGHALMKKEAKNASCTDAGNIEHYACTVCGKTFRDAEGTEEVTDVTIPADGHTLMKKEAKNASCTDAGNVEHYTCTVCGKTFRDAEGTEEITYITVPATGHTYGEWQRMDENLHRRVCANDPAHVETEDHAWNEGKTTREATIEEEGEAVYTCAVCGEEKTESIPVLPHEEIKDGQSDISVSFASDAFSAGVTLKVQPVTETKPLLDENYSAVTAFEIATFVGDQKEQPRSSVTVRIPVPQGYHTETTEVYHIADSGAREKVAIRIENGFIIFKADNFSIYVVVDTSSKADFALGDVDGDGEVSSGDARLALRASVQLEKYEPGSAPFLAADADKNGEIESSDARTILRVSVKLEAFA